MSKIRYRKPIQTTTIPYCEREGFLIRCFVEEAQTQPHTTPDYVFVETRRLSTTGEQWISLKTF